MFDEGTDAGDAIPLKRASAIVSQPSESKDVSSKDIFEFG